MRLSRWRVVLPCLLCWHCLATTAQAASEPQWREVNGVSLRYQVTGRGDDTVVLLHELGMSLETWDDVARSLEKQHRVLRYDLRGFGLSEKVRGTIRFEDHVADLSALLQALNVTQPVTLIGGAVGGAIALHYAATYPQQVRSLIALSPAVTITGAAREGMQSSIAQLRSGGAHAMVDQLMDSAYPPRIRTDATALARYRGMQLAQDVESWAASLNMILAGDFSAVYPRVQCPALIVAAGLYPSRPPETMKAIADQLPRGEFAVLNTGHFMANQAPDLLNTLIAARLQQVNRLRK